MKEKNVTEKVFAYIRKHHMLNDGDRVIAGISGGADSVCLLFVLLEWAKQSSLELAVVHVNHGIRAEAGEDAAYVKQLCDRFGIRFYLKMADVRRRAEQEKCSEEEAGRKTRYEAFAEAAEDFGASVIAVAHNKNDRSETMLFHLLRGSGLKGLGSILPVRDRIIRPLLCLEREEIENYLNQQQIRYCQDSTNATDDYTRNRIRHHILPYADAHIAQGCVSHIARAAELLAETEDYLEQQTEEAVNRCVCCTACSPDKYKGYEIEAAALLALHPVLQKRMLHRILKELSPQQKDITALHIDILLELFYEAGNRSVNLPFGIVGKREYDRVAVGILKEQAAVQDQSSGNIPILFADAYPHYAEYPMAEGKVLTILVDTAANFYQKTKEVPQNQYTKWFDYDKMKKSLVLRTRQTGDYLTISDGAGKLVHKSLKDYMINVKIPAALRDQIPVLAQGSHVLWLAGYRISEFYKVDGNTKYILQVQLITKENSESVMEEKNGRAY